MTEYLNEFKRISVTRYNTTGYNLITFLGFS